MVCICYIVTLLIVWHQECSEVERHEQDRQTERKTERQKANPQSNHSTSAEFSQKGHYLFFHIKHAFMLHGKSE